MGAASLVPARPAATGRRLRLQDAQALMQWEVPTVPSKTTSPLQLGAACNFHSVNSTRKASEGGMKEA